MRIATVLILCVVSLAGCGDLPDEADTEAAGPPVEVASVDLAKAYAANEAAAQQQYGGHTLVVSGRVQSIDLDFMDEPVVVLPGADEFTSVQAKLAESHHDAAGSLNKGQEIAVTCTELTEIVGSPMLDNCTF